MNESDSHIRCNLRIATVKVLLPTPSGQERGLCFSASLDSAENQLCRRFERPESFFQHTIAAIRHRRKEGFKLGCTTEKAAHDIGNGLSKKNPPRFLYTGATLLHALFWGCVQVWLRTDGLAETGEREVNLPEAARLAPREWKGPYQEPKKIPAAVAARPEE